MKRDVEPVEEFFDDVLDQITAAPEASVTAAYDHIKNLRHSNPLPDKRCGLLAERYEIYILEEPECSHALIISLDTKSDNPWNCVVHGLVDVSLDLCQAGRELATKHLSLSHPSWDTR